MKFSRLISAMVMVTALSISAPVLAADPAALEAEGVRVWKMLPRASEMIRHPGPQGWEVYGTKAKASVKSAKGAPGGQALQIKIKGAGANPWDIGANAKTQVATKSGDVLMGAFWARAKRLPDGVTQTTLPYHLQEQGGDYAQYKSENAVVTADWNQYFIYGEIPQKFKKGGVGLAVQLATGKHTIELGPIYIMNMGQGAVDPAVMPRNKGTQRAQILAPRPVQKAEASPQGAIPAALQSDIDGLKKNSAITAN